MGLTRSKWIFKDTQSLIDGASGELQVRVTGAIERTTSGINVKATSITNAMLAGSIADEKLAEQYLKADGTRAATAALSMGGFAITNLADPINDQDAATKAYVDAVAQGLIVKDAVQCATIGNITLSGLQTIDGYAVSAGDRVLVMNQTDAKENGIYVAASGDWTRATDFDGTPQNEVKGGCFTFVQSGDVNGVGGFVVTGGAIVLGTDDVNFTQFSGANTYDAGSGMTRTGNRFDVGAGDGIQADADSITVKIDGATLSKSSSGLKVADAGITATQLAASVAGAGLVGGAGSALDVNVGDGIDVAADKVTVKIDGSTLTKSATGLKVNALGITTNELANTSVTKEKLNSDVVGAGLSGAAGSALAVVAGDGIDVGTDVSVDVTDLIDTAAGLTEDANNNIQVNLAAAGGLSFDSGAIQIDSSVAGDGLSLTSGVMSVNVGDGLDISSDSIVVDVTDFIDTNSGLKEDAANNIQVNLEADGGLGFDATNKGIEIKLDGGSLQTTGSGTKIAAGGVTATEINSSAIGNGLTGGGGTAVAVVAGNGIASTPSGVALTTLTSDWDLGGKTITGIADPSADTDAATKGYVDNAVANMNSAAVEQFTLTAQMITDKAVTLSQAPASAQRVVLIVKDAPGMFYGDDYQMDSGVATKLSWSGLALDGLLAAGDKVTVSYDV